MLEMEKYRYVDGETDCEYSAREAYIISAHKVEWMRSLADNYPSTL